MVSVDTVHISRYTTGIPLNHKFHIRQQVLNPCGAELLALYLLGFDGIKVPL
jgi:hypothetical protein